MSRKTSSTSPKSTKPEAPAKKQPDYIVYHVRRGQNANKAAWTPVGAAWNHDPTKSQGINIVLHTLPLDGKLTLLPNEPSA